MKSFLAYFMLLFSIIGFSQVDKTSSAYRIKSARKQAKKFLRKQGIPGMAISISKNGKLFWSEGFGYATRKPKTDVKPNETLFRIASISKSITAVTLAKLVDDGKIDLDESIYTYLPNYPKKSYDFTLRELGGHLAGIRSYKGSEFTINKKLSITEGVDLFKNDPLIFEPSTQFSYNTFGYVLLSKTMEEASQTEFNALVGQTLFEPLNMEQTMVEDSAISHPNKAQSFRTKRTLSTPVANEYKVAGGGFLSTSEDLIRFGQELIEPTIISKDVLKEITTSQKLKNGNVTGYGIGFSVEKTKNNSPRIYHSGGGVGASTILSIYPQENLVICILTNRSNIDKQKLALELEDIFLD